LAAMRGEDSIDGKAGARLILDLLWGQERAKG
jgi:hypothetical protein